MAQAYAAEGMTDLAVFELTFRKLPPHYNYIVAAGVGDVLDFLSGFRFEDNELDYLRKSHGFSEQFLAILKHLRFTGDVYAVPEGTVVFPNEPIVQVIAPIMTAQLMETVVLNQVHFQSLAATKAARILEAAEGRDVVDFGSRRAHGADAAIKVARATYLTGGLGTSNVLAGKLYGIPTFGTMAHSYIQAHEDEAAAFEAFTSIYPETTLLVDTYDTPAGVQLVINLKRKMKSHFRVRAVRLDSGDLGALAFQTRKMLDEAGLEDVTIFASSSLDEYEIRRLVQSGAPIDAFGVGTKLAVIDGAANLDMAYKLVEYAGKGRLKLSSRKVLYPGRKQVYREFDSGFMLRDVIGRFDEQQAGHSLLQPVMQKGTIVSRIDLQESRRHFQRERARLPNALRQLDSCSTPYSVKFSDTLQREFETVRDKIGLALQARGQMNF